MARSISVSTRPLFGHLASVLALRLLPEWVVDAVMAILLAWTWVDPFWAGPSGPLLPVPELRWTPDVIPYDLAWEKSSGTLVYAALPATLTIYFTLRAAWYAFWWHMARTGRLEGSHDHRRVGVPAS